MPVAPVAVCRVLGPVELSLRGGPAPAELLWRKHLALLVYLARSPKQTRTREQLVGLFWADKAEAAARHSLNEALRVLRRALGDDALVSTGGQVRLLPGVVQLDLEQLEELSRQRRNPEAAALIAGEFLEGFAVPGAQGFEDWVAAERQFWRARCIAVLLDQAETSLRAGRSGEANTLAHRALTLDPLSEPAMRALMLSLAVAGDAATALDRYRGFAERLHRELGGAPAPETRALAERLRGERTLRVRPQPSPLPVESRRAPLVGREAELGELLDLWSRTASTGPAAVAILAGDTGTGKSRLAHELLTRARLQGAAVSVVRAVEGDREQTWSGVMGLARGGLLQAPGLAGAPPEALASLAARSPEWAERFGHIAVGDSPTSAGPALSAIIGAIGVERPVLLVVDDAHWLDRESLLALFAAQRDAGAARLLVLLTVTTFDARPEIDQLRTRVGGDVPGAVVELAALPVSAVREICAWALPNYSPLELDRVSRRIATDSAGLPLIAVELIHAVASGLDLQASPGAWPAPLRTLEHSLPGDLPDTVVSAIRVGFRRLSPAAQQTLVAAAVFGERVALDALARGTGFDTETLCQALDELEWQRWLASDALGYSFVARIARQVIARDMVTPGQGWRIRARMVAAP